MGDVVQLYPGLQFEPKQQQAEYRVLVSSVSSAADWRQVGSDAGAEMKRISSVSLHGPPGDLALVHAFLLSLAPLQGSRSPPHFLRSRPPDRKQVELGALQRRRRAGEGAADDAKGPPGAHGGHRVMVPAGLRQGSQTRGLRVSLASEADEEQGAAKAIRLPSCVGITQCAGFKGDEEHDSSPPTPRFSENLYHRKPAERLMLPASHFFVPFWSVSFFKLVALFHRMRKIH
ncbi:uncharacterized protein LOC126071381 [Elephas maximus indicus]|uniref:uncharacterized protein LOC126071381 n=1 Tax=Elephas maximus indicus TaxID=99487 RepID=UPI0021170B7F|nr:uncharacterized protein LOC126071381 [Elephas maximus indicus]